MSEVTNIRVAVRCRPLSKKELGNKEKSIFRLNNGNVCLTNPGDGKESTFNFDKIFLDDSVQTEVWDYLGEPLLNKCIEGFNGTVFAYGQTGSGKTFSMQGVQQDPILKGLIPRFTTALFDRVKLEKEKDANKLFLVTCSYFEIYNEVISDLLDPSAKKKGTAAGLDVKEHPVLGVYVKGLQEIVVEVAQKMDDLIQQGMACRHVAATAMNEESSRSHSVFTIKIHQKDATDDSKSMFAKVNLVDLAGSERAKSTGASGATLKEGANINKSLSALGNVINALVESAKNTKKKQIFIPYRNSKLTRVLQESLGGNSITAMLAALSPAAVNHDETLSTLNYAARAKSIKLSAKKNEEASQVSKLNDEIAALKKKLADQLTGAGGGGGGGGDASGSATAGGEIQFVANPEAEEKFKNQIKELEAAMHDTWEQKQKLSLEKESERKELMVEQREAILKAQEEREKRWQMIEEKDDVELSVRNVCDTVVELPTNDWLRKVRQMLSLEQETREETTVTSVYRNAFVVDNALLSLVSKVDKHMAPIDETSTMLDSSSISSFSLRQLVSKLAHLQTTGKKLLTTQGELINFTTDFVREIRSSCERWEEVPIEEKEAARQDEEDNVKGTQMSEDQIKEKAVREANAQMREDAARGLRMIVRQLNKKRIEVNSVIAEEREKLFAVMEQGKVIMKFVDMEISKCGGLSTEDKVFEQGEIDDMGSVLKSAFSKMDDFFEAQKELRLGMEDEEGGKKEDNLEESMDISESDMNTARVLGVGSGKILNKQMTASNDGEGTSSSARLNCRTKAGGWIGEEEEEGKEQYLQIDMKRHAIVTSVMTQGLFVDDGHVKRVSLSITGRGGDKKFKTETRKVKRQIKKQKSINKVEMVPPHSVFNVTVKQINDDLTQTKEMLGTMISWPTLLKSTPPEKLLGRPPVRFLFDLIHLLSRTSKFGQDQPWSKVEWGNIQNKHEKIEFMDGVIRSCVTACGGEANGVNIPARGADIVTGQEGGNTNTFLQLMGIASSATMNNIGPDTVCLGGENKYVEVVEEMVEETVEEEVEIEVVEEVKEEVEGGGEGGPKFVKEFKIMFSLDGKVFEEAGEFSDGINEAKTFTLTPPIPNVRFLRFVPKKWTGAKPCMRVDIVGLYRDERENAKALVSPRMNYSSVASGLSLTGVEFAERVNVLISSMHECVNALLGVSEKQETGEKKRAKMKKDSMLGAMTNLAEEKEELGKQLEKANEWGRGLEAQVAELMAKAQVAEFGIIKLQAEKEKDVASIENLKKVENSWKGEKKELERVVVELEGKVEGVEVELGEKVGEGVVLTEERDLAREREEILFEKVADVVMELEALQESYVYMTERCNGYQDDIMDLEEKAEGYQELIKKMAINQPVVLKSSGKTPPQPVVAEEEKKVEEKKVEEKKVEEEALKVETEAEAEADEVANATITPSTSLSALHDKEEEEEGASETSEDGPRKKTESEIEAEELAEMYGGDTEVVETKVTGEIAVKKKKKTKKQLEEEEMNAMYGETGEEEGGGGRGGGGGGGGGGEGREAAFDGTGELRGKFEYNGLNNYEDEEANEKFELPTVSGVGGGLFADPDPRNNSFQVPGEGEGEGEGEGGDFIADYGGGDYGEDFEEDFEIASTFEQKKKARPGSANRKTKRPKKDGARGFTGI